MTHFALTALGRDRPGIVEGVTRVLLDHGMNLEDSQMTILRGRFTMMLIVAGDPGLEVDRLEADLDAAATELGLDALALRSVEAVPAEPSEPTHIVTVYGADHPGIVHAVAAAVAGEGCNIADLNTRVGAEYADGEEPLYVVLMEMLVPDGRLEAVEGALDRVAADQGVEVSVRELEHDAL